MKRHISFHGGMAAAPSSTATASTARPSTAATRPSTAAARPSSSKQRQGASMSAPNLPREGLVKERPPPAFHPGQDLPLETLLKNRPGTLRHGYERLGHMYTLGTAFKFEELQGRHPFDFVEETREHYKLRPDPVKKPAEPEDTTLFEVREWLEPLIRKGQLYWDYCRDKWIEKESRLGAACGPICCMFSLWTIGDCVLHYGGLVFIAVYFLVTVLFIIPFIYMELTLGQFHRTGLEKAMRRTCPLFHGLAYLMLMYCLVEYLLSMVRVSWLFFYLVHSLDDGYPWSNCSRLWDPKLCVEVMDHDNSSSVTPLTGDQRTPVVEWYRVIVYRPWKHWEMVFGPDPPASQVLLGLFPHPKIFLGFLLLLFVFRALVKKPCKEFGRRLAFVSFVAITFCVLCVFASDSYIPDDTIDKILDWVADANHLQYFYNIDTWVVAIRHAVISSGIGTGIYITFGSHNTFPNDDLKRTASLSAITSFLIHSFIGVFLAMCHFTIRTTFAFANADKDNFGYDLIFEQYPQLVAQHHEPGVSHLMFSMMFMGLLLLVSMRVICGLRVLCQFFYDRDKEFYEPCRCNYNYWEHHKIKRQQRHCDWHLTLRRKDKLLMKILLYTSIFQVVTFLPGGAVLRDVLELFWYNYVPMLIITLEVLAVFFFAGLRTVNDYVRRMTTWQTTLWFRFAWKTFMPLVPLFYLLHPPRIQGKFGELHLPDWTISFGYACAVISPLFIMYTSMFSIWKKSRARTFSKKFLLEIAPEYEHAGMIAGRKPSTRLHWMHHLQVPSGISRGLCLPSYDLAPKKADPNRFNGLNRWLNFLWYTLKFSWFNSFSCENSAEDEDDWAARNFQMFPPRPYPVKPPKPEKPMPEYLSSQQIKRIFILKKEKREFKKQRQNWLAEKVDLERERMAAELDEREIETGILGTTPAMAPKEEDEEEKPLFDVFNVSSGEEGGTTTSLETTEETTDISSADPRKNSSPSVSTNDSFDSQDSIFRASGDDDHHHYRKWNAWKHLDSSSSDDDECGEGEEEEDEGANQEIPAPLMDYGDDYNFPYDDDADSWDLEDLENIEEDLDPAERQGEEITTSSEDETDTDQLAAEVEKSASSSSSSSSSVLEDNKEEQKDRKSHHHHHHHHHGYHHENAEGEEGEEDDEVESWSDSCGSSGTCSSSGSTSSSEEDEDEEEAVEESVISEDEFEKKPVDKSKDIQFYRNVAENLDTFLHYSKKKEKERIEIIQEQVNKAKIDEHEKAERDKKLNVLPPALRK